MNKSVILALCITILSIVMLILYFKVGDRSVIAPEQAGATTVTMTPAEPEKQDKTLIDLNQRNQVKSLPVFKAISVNDVQAYQIPNITQHPEDGFLFSFDHLIMQNQKVGNNLQFQMLKFDINRQATIQKIENLDQDIVRWTGTFDGKAEDLNWFTITQSQKDQYALIKIFTEKGNYVAEVKNGVGLAIIANDNLEHDGIHHH